MVAAAALFGLPLASFLVATLGQLQHVARKRRLTPARAAQTFTVLGIAAFALVVTLGLLVYVGGSIRETLTVLSPSLSVAAAIVMGTGIADPSSLHVAAVGGNAYGGNGLGDLRWHADARHTGPGVAGTRDSVAVSLVTAVAFAALACVGQVPILHAGAIVAATFAYLLVFLRLSVPLDRRRGAER